MNAATPACIGLGGNLGDPEATLTAALAGLGALPQTRLMRASRLYRTPAWGNEDQPAFVNAAALVETTLPPLQLLDALLALERKAGRERDREQRWGPRVLDLDLLLYGDEVIDLPQLKVPHPYLHQRAFALVPLAEVAPEALIAGHGTVRDMLRGVDTRGVEPLRR